MNNAEESIQILKKIIITLIIFGLLMTPFVYHLKCPTKNKVPCYDSKGNIMQNQSCMVDKSSCIDSPTILNGILIAIVIVGILIIGFWFIKLSKVTKFRKFNLLGLKIILLFLGAVVTLASPVLLTLIKETGGPIEEITFTLVGIIYILTAVDAWLLGKEYENEIEEK